VNGLEKPGAEMASGIERLAPGLVMELWTEIESAELEELQSFLCI
jgi:hypothetical protein